MGSCCRDNRVPQYDLRFGQMSIFGVFSLRRVFIGARLGIIL